jgi:LPS-assembly protein
MFISLSAGIKSARLPSAGDTNYLEYEADNFEYDKAEDTMILKGNVKITERNRPDNLPVRTMRAEEFIIHPSKGILKSPGAMVMEEGLNAIYGEQGVFNQNTNQTLLKSASANYASWRILKAKEVITKDEKHIYKKVTVTSCNKEKPHYRFRFSRLSVIPKKRIFGYNGILYAGKIPVFYLPFMYQSLGTEHKYVTYLDLGYDERSGTQIKTTTVYRFNENVLGKAYFDYFTRLAFGAGLGFEVKNTEKLNMDLDTYRIKESGSSLDRWGITGGYNYIFKDTLAEGGSRIYSQSQFRLVSDPSFNNDFFRSNPYAVSPDNNADVSVVYQNRKINARAGYVRKQTRLGDNNFFTTTSESRPVFDFNLTPFKILNSPFLNNFNTHFESTKTTATGYFKKTARAKYSINKTIPVTRGVSFLPQMFYDQEVIFHPRNTDGTAMPNQWIGRWGSDLNMRVSHGLGSLDVSHGYTRRLKPNKLLPDSGAEDHGVEQNIVNVSNFIRPNRKVYMRFNTGFDMRDRRNAEQHFSSRLEPVFVDIAYLPSKDFGLFLQNQYKTGEGNQSVVLQGVWGQEEKTHLSLGFANYKTNPSDYLINGIFLWKPEGRSWYVEFGLGIKAHLSEKSTFKDLTVFSKRFTLYKAIHDFFTTWTVHLRPGVKSISFGLGLRFEEPTRRIKSEREKERFKSDWKEESRIPQGV